MPPKFNYDKQYPEQFGEAEAKEYFSKVGEEQLQDLETMYHTHKSTSRFYFNMVMPNLIAEIRRLRTTSNGKDVHERCVSKSIYEQSMRDLATLQEEYTDIESQLATYRDGAFADSASREIRRLRGLVDMLQSELNGDPPDGGKGERGAA